MPTYKFCDTEYKIEFEKFMKISELDDYLKDNPNLEQVPTAPPIISGREGGMKPDEGFREILKGIKKSSGKDINTFD